MYETQNQWNKMKEKQLKSEQDSLNNSKPLKKKRRKKPKVRKKLGRKRKKRLFEETRVGYFLKHEAPLEYGLIMEVCGNITAPSADLIETIGYTSINLLFKKPKFRKALIEYRKHGVYCGPPKKTSAETLAYYIGVRRNNAYKVGVK